MIMDMKNSLINFLKQEILEDINIDIDEDEALLSTGIIDSLGLMRIVRHIERQLNVTVPFEDITLENFETITSSVNYTKKLQN